MQKDEILNEILVAIRDLMMIHKKLDEMEKERGLAEDEAFDALIDSNEEYLRLENESSKISDRIAGLFIRSNYYSLLIGLSYDERRVAEKLRKAFIPTDRQVEEVLDEMLLLRRNEMIERLKQLPSLDLTEHLRPRIKGLYQQVMLCYVDGAFEASCVLCRAITESIAKRYITERGYGDLLVGKDKQSKMMSVPDILKNILSVPDDMISLYGMIGRKADNILHAEDAQAKEEDALNAVTMLASFINKFPKAL